MFNPVDVLSSMLDSIALFFTAPFRQRGGNPPGNPPKIPPMTPVSSADVQAAQLACATSLKAILNAMLQHINTQIRLLDFVLAAQMVNHVIVNLTMVLWVLTEVWVHAFSQSVPWLWAEALLIFSCSWFVPLALQGVLALVRRFIRARHLRQLRVLEQRRKAAEERYNELRKRLAYQFFRSLEQETYRTYQPSSSSQPSQPSQPDNWA